MSRVPIGQVAKINPRPPKGLDDSQAVSFVAMASVSEGGMIVTQETRQFGSVKKGYTYFERGDILLAKITPCFENGKAALADSLEHQIGFGSTEFHVLRADPRKVNAKYLFSLVWSSWFRSFGEKIMKGAAGQKRVPADFIENFEIPLPSLDDQIRIAHLLGKVEGLIAQRKQQLQQLDDLLKSVFLEMFGDQEKWPLMPLSSIAAEGKGTFSNGPFGSNLLTSELGDSGVPVVYIRDIRAARYERVSTVCVSQEKANELSTCIVEPGDILVAKVGDPPGTAAIYPKGEPIGVITQDVIRLRPNAEIVNAEFVSAFLNSHLGCRLIREITVEATRARFGLREFKAKEIPIPPIDVQDEFAAISERVESVKTRYQQSLTDLEALYGALSQQAFKGELDLSRVPLPEAEPQEPQTAIPAAGPSPDDAPNAIDLPDTELLRAALDDRTRLKELLPFWLETYRAQLNGAAFSAQAFLTATQTRLAELHPDNDFELDADAYEQVKTWVFKALASGHLKQGYADADNRVTLASQSPDWGTW